MLQSFDFKIECVCLDQPRKFRSRSCRVMNHFMSAGVWYRPTAHIYSQTHRTCLHVCRANLQREIWRLKLYDWQSSRVGVSLIASLRRAPLGFPALGRRIVLTVGTQLRDDTITLAAIA